MLARRRTLTPSAAEAGEQLDILIAEDDNTQQALYRATLESWALPIKLRLVNNGFEGLMQVGQRAPDILIADLMMPGMDGFEMIRQLRANPALAQMDIIVVSAIDVREIREKGVPPTLPLRKPVPSTKSRVSSSAAWRPASAPSRRHACPRTPRRHALPAAVQALGRPDARPVPGKIADSSCPCYQLRKICYVWHIFELNHVESTKLSSA
jgi:CheY-like chemotaxis protein